MSNDAPMNETATLNEKPPLGGMPSVLQPNVKNEMSNVEVESIILPSVSHTFNAN